MKKILIICHLKENRFDGQQSKTNDVIFSFRKRGYDVDILNYGHCSSFTLIFKSLKRIRSHRNILMLPGGKKALFLYAFLSRFFKNKNFYYLAVGGWITDLIQSKSSRRKLKPLKKFKSIVLQNKQSVEIFSKYGFTNVCFVPTFSSKPQITDEEFRKSLINFDNINQYRFCFFARIEETKGIFEACNVIKRLAKENYNVKLDIYGQIQKEEVKSKLSNYLDENIRYLGILHDDSVKTLSTYYCMLFPTYYKGEGMAHSIIESFMAGLPVIASDWKFNSELVKENENGFLVNLDNLENNLYDKVLYAIKHSEIVKKMRFTCFETSKKYNSESVLKTFIDTVDKYY